MPRIMLPMPILPYYLCLFCPTIYDTLVDALYNALYDPYYTL